MVNKYCYYYMICCQFLQSRSRDFRKAADSLRDVCGSSARPSSFTLSLSLHHYLYIRLRVRAARGGGPAGRSIWRPGS